MSIGTTSTRTHHQWDIKPIPATTITQDTSGTFPGTVVAQLQGGNYQVNVFTKSIDDDPTTVTARRLLPPDDDGTPLSAGTPVTVVKNVWFETTGPSFNPKTQIRVEYTMEVSGTSVPSVFPGLVQSKVGGNDYLVNIYKRGMANETTSVTATQLGAVATDTIPANTPCQVIETIWVDEDKVVHTEYTMNVAVWATEDGAE